MRCLFLITLLVATLSAPAQIIALVSDTSRVGLYRFPDSTYYLKNAPEDTSYIIYYGDGKTQTATSRVYISKNRYDTKYWYSDGTPKKFELNIDSLPYYQKELTMWFPDGHLQKENKTTRDSLIMYDWWSNHQLQMVRKFWGTPWKYEFGHTRFWNGSGFLVEQKWITPDSIITHNYFDNGAISWKRLHYRDTSAEQGWTCYYDETFHPNGVNYRTAVYPVKGRQACTYFYPSGNKKAECDWMEGNIGPYKEWYDSGKIKAEGNYSMGTKYFPGHHVTNYYPTKTGHWIYYTEAGWIEKEEWRDFDGIVITQEYNEKGDVTISYQTQERIFEGTVFPENLKK
jgi:antitoxin component YwqK of YwqJK toxin-antitoxin module